MFQFKNAGLATKEPDTSNALPNSFGKVRTFKEDLENFEKGTSVKEVSEEATLPPSGAKKNITENPPKIEELPAAIPASPEAAYPPNSPFQSIPTPPPIPSPGASANSDTHLPSFKSSPSQSFFAENKPPKTNSLPKLENQSEQPAPKKKKRSFILPLIIVLLLAIAGAGFYYYWFNIKNNSSTGPSTPAASDPQSAPPVVSPSPATSQNKNLRTLVIDVSQGPTEIKNSVQKFADEFVASASENNLTEVKLSGKDGQSVGKKDFFAGFSVTVPDAVLMKLSEDYSLFIRKENGSARLGFVFKTITSSGLTDAMKNWEPTLATDLTPLYAGQAPTGAGAFNSSQYKNADIRYFNFSSPTDTSLDYSIISNFLVIGSSKDTTRAILDYMSGK